MNYMIASLPIALYALALLLGLFNVDLPFASPLLHPLAQWMLLLSLALQSLWAAFGHIFASERVARSIGWAPSPFQHEIGAANVGIGLDAIVAAILGPTAAWAIFFCRGKLCVRRGSGSHQRHGSQRESCNQQCRPNFLVGYPHTADAADRAPLSLSLALTNGSTNA